MSKSRNFSIFLLKEKFTAKNALKKDNSLKSKIKASQLSKGSTLYISDNHPTPPWWKDYWGINKDLKQVLKGAIVFLPVGERCFALTFGHTHHNLKEECFEYDFGLITTLNALNPKEIKTTEILDPESAKRKRIQSPTASDLTFFDFDKDESIVKNLSGKVKSEYKDYFASVSGTNSLKISSKYEASNLESLCTKLLELYKKRDYKEIFPDIGNVSPIKDPTILAKLNKNLEKAFKKKSTELVLTIPEIIDNLYSLRIEYHGAGGKNKDFDENNIYNYQNYLHENQCKVSIEKLKNHVMYLIDENGAKHQSYSIYRCILFECNDNNEYYHLCDGDWYKIEKEYIKKLKKELDPIFTEHPVLKICNAKDEASYNKEIAAKNKSYHCLDKTNITISGQTQIEPCDLITAIDNIVHLLHIKISTKSASLSHLFNQGLNSIQLLRTSEEAKDRLKTLIRDEKLSKLIDKDKFEVVYGIISEKDKNKKSDNLPIFSRITLSRTMKTFKIMGIKCSVVFIHDNRNNKKKCKNEKGDD